MFPQRRAHIASLILPGDFFRTKSFIISAFLLLFAALLHSQSFYLPSDEREGDYLLENGLIDSLIWSYLAPLYSAPISVPEGELDLLEPIIENDLSNIEYRKYEPWDNRDIQQFFLDYPFLEPFRPVLCFNRQKKVSNGDIGLSFSKLLGDNKVEQLIQFNYLAEPFIQTKGNIVLRETNARWRSRTLTVSFPALNAQIGNFKHFANAIFFGFFEPAGDFEDSSTVIKNWLYPQSNSWNGLKIAHIRQSGLQEVSLFYHQRTTEKILSAGVSVDAKICTLVTGLSNIQLTGYADIFYLHLLSTFALHPDFGLELETGVDLESPGKLPFLIRGTHRVRGHRFDFESYYFPRGLGLPQSRMKRSLLRKSGMSDAPESQVGGLRICTRHLLGRGIRFAPQIEIIRTDNMPLNTNSSVMLSMDWILSTHLRYSISAKPLTSDVLYHYTFLSLRWAPHPAVGLQYTQRYNYSPVKGYRYSFRFECNVNKRDVSCLTPFLRGYKSFYGEDLVLGFRQELTLNKKTRTVFSMEKSLQERGWDNVLIRGVSEFLF